MSKWLKEKTNRVKLGIGISITVFLFVLVLSSVTQSMGGENSQWDDNLSGYIQEQETLLGDINYHQGQANTLSIRLGKVQAAVSALKELQEEPKQTHSVAEVGKTQSQ